MKNKKSKKTTARQRAKKYSHFGLMASAKSFKLDPLSCKKFSDLLPGCRGGVQFCQRNYRTLLICLLFVSLLINLLGPAFNHQEMTFYQANQQSVDHYLKFLADSYGAMTQQTLNIWGKVVYWLAGNIKVAVGDTVLAYSAILQPAGKLLAKVFVGSGEVLSVVSYAMAMPARVMAQTLP
ncbi:hypothetical protein KJ840_05340 [Patescibacteria group bacterium]|nr:hypothetical protein [Patescibacteria group bacterium]